MIAIPAALLWINPVQTTRFMARQPFVQFGYLIGLERARGDCAGRGAARFDSRQLVPLYSPGLLMSAEAARPPREKR